MNLENIDPAKLDEKTREQLAYIELKNQVQHLGEELAKAVIYLDSLLDSLDKRVDVLEEARQQQIKLNSSFATKANPSQPKKSWLWEIFK